MESVQSASQFQPVTPEFLSVTVRWDSIRKSLRRELGENRFGSWLGSAQIVEQAPDCYALVTQTLTARDWVRTNAWAQISNLWQRFGSPTEQLELKSLADMNFPHQESSEATVPSFRVVPCEPSQAVIEIERVSPSGTSASPAAAPEPQVRTQVRASAQAHLTFDSFVAGPANAIAHAAALRMADWNSPRMGPLLLHGPYGYGKTHLLNAIANAAQAAAPDRKVVCLSAERFLQAFVQSVKGRDTMSFKADVRGADLLILDDLQFVAGKTSTQEELLYTLAALLEDGRRVVVSADLPLSQIADLNPRLRDHLSSGPSCAIEPADFDMRVAILERKFTDLASRSASGGMPSIEILRFLATSFTDSIRELEGAVNTLVACCSDSIEQMTLEQVQTMLRPHLKGSEKRITVDDIQRATAEHYGMQKAELISSRRNRSIARPRQAAMWLAKKLTTRSLPDIGKRFGGRDHTTVIHAVKRIEALRETDLTLANDLDLLMRRLKS